MKIYTVAVFEFKNMRERG